LKDNGAACLDLCIKRESGDIRFYLIGAPAVSDARNECFVEHEIKATFRGVKRTEIGSDYVGVEATNFFKQRKDFDLVEAFDCAGQIGDHFSSLSSTKRKRLHGTIERHDRSSRSGFLSDKLFLDEHAVLDVNWCTKINSITYLFDVEVFRFTGQNTGVDDVDY